MHFESQDIGIAKSVIPKYSDWSSKFPDLARIACRISRAAETRTCALEKFPFWVGEATDMSQISTSVRPADLTEPVEQPVSPRVLLACGQMVSRVVLFLEKIYHSE
jgi:hypothetical protein